MAAEVLASSGLSVSLFEHRRSPANKFLVAGRGGLNISNSEPLDRLLDRYGPDRSFLEAAVKGWSPTDVQAWLAGLGEPAFVGSSGRVFPASMRATPLLRSWLARLAEMDVTLHTGQRWVGFDGHDREAGDAGGIAQRFDADERTERFDAWLFALGGGSWPRLGTDGSWAEPFAAAGVEIVPLQASNCGVIIAWTPVMTDRFAGTPVKNVSVSCGVEDGGDPDQGSAAVRGDIVVTATGLEGGPIYAHGREVRRQLCDGQRAQLTLDLSPDLSPVALRERLNKRRSGATATSWLRGAGLDAVKVALLREATANQLPTEVDAMAALIKRCAIDVRDLASVDRAISTAGGVSKDAVDDAFMLHAQPGCFVAGEMLDFDAPTGGYLLQASLSTGVAAAHGIARWLAQTRET